MRRFPFHRRSRADESLIRDRVAQALRAFEPYLQAIAARAGRAKDTDFIAELHLAAIRALPRYDAKQGKVSTYLWKCCRRRAIDLYRAAASRSRRERHVCLADDVPDRRTLGISRAMELLDEEGGNDAPE